MAGKQKRTPYSITLVETAHVMYVQQGKSAVEIARELNGPTHQTITNWANRQRKAPNGKLTSWVIERAEFSEAEYARLSPAAQAQKIMAQMNMIISKPPSSFTTKDADALAKMQKLLSEVTAAKYQVPMMFEVLTDFVGFLKLHYPEQLSEPFNNALLHFKNVKLAEAQL